MDGFDFFWGNQPKAADTQVASTPSKAKVVVTVRPKVKFASKSVPTEMSFMRKLTAASADRDLR